MNSQQVVLDVMEMIGRNGHVTKKSQHVFLTNQGAVRVRWQSAPESDGVTYAFQISKKRQWWRIETAYRADNHGVSPFYWDYDPFKGQYELWICRDATAYYLIPKHVIAELCLWPGSYRHEDYHATHRRVHINTTTHQCCYTGKCVDFSNFYRIRH